MNNIFLTNKCNIQLKEIYVDYINNTNRKVNYLEYLTELFNPSNRGIIYTKISEYPLKIKIWSKNIEITLEEYANKEAFKTSSVKKIDQVRFDRILKFAQRLEGEWKFSLITSEEIQVGENLDFIRVVECFNEKKQAFDEYNKYWLDSDIITKKREEKSKENKKKSLSKYTNIASDFDNKTVIIKISKSDYKFKKDERIKIIQDFKNNNDLEGGLLIGKVKKYNSSRKELTINVEDIKLLELMGQDKKYKCGLIYVDDLGTLTMLSRQKKALQKLFNRETRNKRLKDFIPNIDEASTYKVDSVKKELLSNNFIKMNESQKKAIISAIECKDINLIQGPPGTGKTTVICEIIKYLAKDNKSVLVSSQNNLAVDNVLQKIGEENDIRAIRIGNEEKFELGCEKYALTNRVEALRHEIIDNIDIRINEKIEKEEFLKKNSKIYNAHIQSKSKISSLIRLFEGLESYKEKIEKNNFELIKVNEAFTENDSKINEITKVVGMDANRVKALYSHLNSVKFDGDNTIRNIEKILEIKVRESDFECIDIYTQVKSSINDSANEYRSIENKLVNIFSEQETLESQFKEIRNKIFSLEIQKDSLSNIMKKYLIKDIENLKIKAELTKEDYRKNSFIIKKLENEKNMLYKKILDLKYEISKYQKDIDCIFEKNSNLKFDKKEFINILKKKQFLNKEANKIGVELSSIKNIGLVDKLEDLENIKKELQNNKESILSDINKCEKYIQVYKSEIESVNSDKQIQLILKHEEIEICDVNTHLLEKMNAFIDMYQQINRKKELLDKTEKLRVEFRNSIDYYQLSFEDVYIGISNVICATCSGIAASNNNDFSEKEFEYVIVDEAAKCFSSELLIPIIKGAKIILVGDHKQLSPIVEKDILIEMEANNEISREEIDIYYNNSLFGIMFNKASEDIKVTLDIQYRMNSDISKFISKSFYDGKLKDGLNIKALSHGIKELEHGLYWLGTEDNVVSQELTKGTSYYNMEESRLIKLILEWIDKKIDIKKEVGIITPYSEQKKCLSDILAECTFENLKLEINTVDAFQGREKEYIIMSCVRNNHKGIFGHVSGDSRINVGVSRAKEMLFVVGNINFIKSNKKSAKSLYQLVNYIEKKEGILVENNLNGKINK